MANYQSYKQIQGDQALVANSVGAGQVVGLATGVAHQFYLWHDNQVDASTAGCCLLWTVPARTTTVKFEVTGGGGSGSIGLCCSNGPSGGSGAYSTRTVFAHCNHFTAGSSRYTLCAGGNSYCSCCGYSHAYNCCGTKGCTSFVEPYDAGAGGMSNFCAEGGSWGYHMCSGGCYTCLHSSQCGMCIATTACHYGANDRGCSFGICGVSGNRQQNTYCMGSDFSFTGGGVGPWAAPQIKTQDNCSYGNTHGCCKGFSLFPGGGGASPFTDGGCCWGGFGRGGLVVVSHWS